MPVDPNVPGPEIASAEAPDALTARADDVSRAVTARHGRGSKRRWRCSRRSVIIIDVALDLGDLDILR